MPGMAGEVSQWPELDYGTLHDRNEVGVLVSNSVTNSLNIQWSMSTERLTNLKMAFQQSAPEGQLCLRDDDMSIGCISSC